MESKRLQAVVKYDIKRPNDRFGLNKTGGTSGIKMKVYCLSFCIALGLDKILTLGNVNKFPFLSLNRFFALSLQTI